MKSLLTWGGWLSVTGVLVAMTPLKQETYHQSAELARQGNVDAQVVAAQALEQGRTGLADPEAAAAIYLAAARQGDRVALDGLARLVGAAKVNDVTATETIALLRTAAANGDRESQFSLACLLWNGVGVKRDREDAGQWLKVAAAGGDADATLFRDYLVADDAVQSSRELELRTQVAARNLSRAGANYMRGVAAESGWRVERDPIVAVQKYRLAADANQPEAMARLGVLLGEGQVVAQDLPEAYVWLHRAAELGVATAARDADRVRAAMTAEQWDATGVKLLAAARR